MQSSAGEEETGMMATMSDAESTSNSFIPDDILVSHILPRPDTRSLARFMSASTHWHSTISAPSFLLSHLSHCTRCSSVSFSSRLRAGYESVVKYWVFRLIGGGEWRPISCPIMGYYSASMGTCINGSICRWASHGSEYLVRRTRVLEFDVGSEEFRLVELPDKTQCREEKECSLVEIDGNLGVIDYREFEYGGNGIKLWVVEGNSNWVKRSIPDWGDIQDPPRLCFKGTTYTGEMMFAPSESVANSMYYVFFYDITVNLLRRFDIQRLPECSGHYDTIYIADHVETLLSLPRVR
ncbi:hypothetical protein RJ639_007860 [Escallonia herrerae]|uniref:F-box associated beta-propeller type 3 domain-containing protein n=1 Tax=Escallonia herrerae TaxID=1293975 RepID=A0AA89AU47_9ASTE|nr:hypothetical protein RJ639_007860 [Escallonia herrerae]